MMACRSEQYCQRDDIRGRRPRRHLLAVAVLGMVSLIAVRSVPAAEEPNNRVLQVEGATVHLEFQSTDFTQGTAPIVAWIKRSVAIVAGYYGHFPAKQLRIRVAIGDGGGVRHGTTYGMREPLIRLQVGRDMTAAALREDWVLVHEMVHLALPEVGDDHLWLTEGLATYVEGIARVQAGELPAERVWSEQVRSMPRGLPQSGDQGLDNTHTWGRTYWGGAMFCLLADVDIRKRTNNRFGLQDALRAVLQSSGGISFDLPLARVLEIGDKAVGTTTLQDLYAQMKDSPVSPDLPALWQQLGIEEHDGTVKLNDNAPLKATREAIMRTRGVRANELQAGCR